MPDGRPILVRKDEKWERVFNRTNILFGLLMVACGVAYKATQHLYKTKMEIQRQSHHRQIDKLRTRHRAELQESDTTVNEARAKNMELQRRLRAEERKNISVIPVDDMVHVDGEEVPKGYGWNPSISAFYEPIGNNPDLGGWKIYESTMADFLISRLHVSLTDGEREVLSTFPSLCGEHKTTIRVDISGEIREWWSSIFCERIEDSRFEEYATVQVRGSSRENSDSAEEFISGFLRTFEHDPLGVTFFVFNTTNIQNSIRNSNTSYRLTDVRRDADFLYARSMHTYRGFGVPDSEHAEAYDVFVFQHLYVIRLGDGIFSIRVAVVTDRPQRDEVQERAILGWIRKLRIYDRRR